MNVNIPRNETLSLAKKVARAAPTAASRELCGLLLEADEPSKIIRLTATNTEVTVRAVMRAEVTSGGSAIIPVAVFIGMLTLLDSDEVCIQSNGETILEFTGGSAKYEISVLPGSMFPKTSIPLPGESIFVSGLKVLISKVSFAIETQAECNGKPNCIRLSFTDKGLLATANNSGSIVQVIGDKDAVGQIDLIVPAASMKILFAISQNTDVYELGIVGSAAAKSLVCHDGTLTFRRVC